MKFIKVVGEGPERKTYIDSGPKCGHEGEASEFGTWKCNGGRLVYYPAGFKNPTGSFECPCCHATGVQAVEDWPDAELDRALNERFDTWDLQMRRELHTNEPSYSIEGRPAGFNMPCDDTSRGAKIWAVIAVAEEER